MGPQLFRNCRCSISWPPTQWYRNFMTPLPHPIINERSLILYHYTMYIQDMLMATNELLATCVTTYLIMQKALIENASDHILPKESSSTLIMVTENVIPLGKWWWMCVEARGQTQAHNIMWFKTMAHGLSRIMWTKSTILTHLCKTARQYANMHSWIWVLNLNLNLNSEWTVWLRKIILGIKTAAQCA